MMGKKKTRRLGVSYTLMCPIACRPQLLPQCCVLLTVSMSCSVFFVVLANIRRETAENDEVQEARLCQLVFKHASEAFEFVEAFDAICANPVADLRKV